VLLTAGALDTMASVVGELEVDAERMRANLEISHGQIFAEAVQMALAPTLGRDAAHELLASASRRALSDHRHLRDVLAEESRVAAVLDRDAIGRLFDPQSYLGSTDVFIGRALARHG
jgi:3-carboxy-cis,cis-muconate cycloisomerase